MCKIKIKNKTFILNWNNNISQSFCSLKFSVDKQKRQNVKKKKKNANF